MGYHIALFVHVVSVATWFGGLSMMAIWLRNAIRKEGMDAKASLQAAHRANMTMLVPTAVLALITGMYMLMSGGWGRDMPLWLIIKERFASLWILLYIVLFSVAGGKLLKKAQEQQDVSVAVKRYILWLNLSLAILILIILDVTFKFS
jgi:protoporphyrinogen IX oxidase